ncbi:MAG: hypothetical protein IPF97_08160 [Sphingomonadales bacterium]|nr:hypothetical protein [Sphingomonadales bacterium]
MTELVRIHQIKSVSFSTLLKVSRTASVTVAGGNFIRTKPHSTRSSSATVVPSPRPKRFGQAVPAGPPRAELHVPWAFAAEHGCSSDIAFDPGDPAFDCVFGGKHHRVVAASEVTGGDAPKFAGFPRTSVSQSSRPARGQFHWTKGDKPPVVGPIVYAAAATRRQRVAPVGAVEDLCC